MRPGLKASRSGSRGGLWHWARGPPRRGHHPWPVTMVTPCRATLSDNCSPSFDFGFVSAYHLVVIHFCFMHRRQFSDNCLRLQKHHPRRPQFWCPSSLLWEGSPPLCSFNYSIRLSFSALSSVLPDTSWRLLPALYLDISSCWFQCLKPVLLISAPPANPKAETVHKLHLYFPPQWSRVVEWINT